MEMPKGYTFKTLIVDMSKIFTILFLLFLTACNRSTFYVLRHAEKETANANMSSDVPLSAAGKERAIALKEKLVGKNLDSIYSTSTIRTRTTAQPLSEAAGLPVQTYDPKDNSFINRLKSYTRGTFLIVGHSNTVDDIVNQFLNQKVLNDLPDTQYGDLFIISKKGDKYFFRKDRFGK